MDRKAIGLLGAVAGLATITSAQARIEPTSSSQALAASSYADLLAPVPNALAVLLADDTARQLQPTRMQGTRLAEDHHHHHHNTVVIKKKSHHHHHRTKVIIKKKSHHHHHHHHHQSYLAIPGETA